ncbi:MAG TPA: sulfur carrier protein ThiS [Phycisphaerae bacterium]|nr:sulfur carrier protein ThiS [Phycisphaerae bacterium]
MKLTLNGEETDLRDALTVTELLVDQNVKMPDMVSIEINGEIVKRSDFEGTVLADGDKVEFLYFMGGGQWD